MTRKEAFTAVISQRGIHHKLNITSAIVRQLRINLEKDKVSEDKMKEILLKAKATLKTQEEWCF